MLFEAKYQLLCFLRLIQLSQEDEPQMTFDHLDTVILATTDACRTGLNKSPPEYVNWLLQFLQLWLTLKIFT